MARGGLLGIFDFIVLLRFPNLLCFARKFGKGLLLLCSLELAQCRLIGFTQIVTDVTSIGSTFLSCIALLGFVSFAFRFIVLLASLDCAGEFRLCGGDHGLCPLDSHKPLKRLERNFKCFCAASFVWLIGFCAKLPPRVLSLGSHFLGRV